MTTCPVCTAQWKGLEPTHCASCHQTWPDVKGFDAHRRNGKCVTEVAK